MFFFHLAVTSSIAALGGTFLAPVGVAAAALGV
jgi:hypothetical protein